MAEPTPVAWLLAPEELVAACEALGVLALPHSAWVADGIDHPRHVAGVGGRSLTVARLATPAPGGPGLELEPRLAAAILALNDPEPDAVAWCVTPVGVTHVAVVAGDRATTMLEGPDGIELIASGPEDALRRLDHQLSLLEAVAFELASESDVHPAAEAVIPRARWDAIGQGRPARSADDPLAVRAALAAAETGTWEAACLCTRDDGGYAGTLGGWVLDERGLMAVETDAEPGDEPALRVRAIVDLGAELTPLWAPLRALIGSRQPV